MKCVKLRRMKQPGAAPVIREPLGQSTIDGNNGEKTKSYRTILSVCIYIFIHTRAVLIVNIFMLSSLYYNFSSRGFHILLVWCTCSMLQCAKGRQKGKFS